MATVWMFRYTLDENVLYERAEWFHGVYENWLLSSSNSSVGSAWVDFENIFSGNIRVSDFLKIVKFQTGKSKVSLSKKTQSLIP